MKNIGIRLPVFPNWFPFNDMLLDGHLKVGEYAGVKTRNWEWDYRGTVLFYNSGRAAHSAVSAYGYQNGSDQHKIIIGAGDLVDVRELTDDEYVRMICNFNNVTRKQVKEGDYSISPLPVGFFFQNLRRFEHAVPFTWPAGPVKPIWTEVRDGSKIARQLEKFT